MVGLKHVARQQRERKFSKASLPSCTDLGRDSANGLAGRNGVLSLLMKVVPANGQDAAHCFVQFVYASAGLSGPKDGYDDDQSQAITIRIGLPLWPDPQ